MILPTKIAIIDSGIGGVSVIRQLISKFKHGKFVYIADNEFMPYGEKSYEDILNRIKYLRFLAREKYKCDYIILACNTASIVASTDESLNDMIKLDFKNSGLYLTTNLTAQCLTKQRTIVLNDLASFIENNILSPDSIDKKVDEIVNKFHLNRYKNIILACTHYELIDRYFIAKCPRSHIINNSKSLIDRLDLNLKGRVSVKIVLTKHDRNRKRLIRNLIFH